MFICDLYVYSEQNYIKSPFGVTTHPVGSVGLPVVDKKEDKVNRVAHIPFSALSIRTCYMDGRIFDEEYWLSRLYTDHNMVNLEALEEIASWEEK
jgi:hypothetical protein